MSENATQCGGLFKNVDNDIVQEIGVHLCQLENSVKNILTQNGIDGFHFLFLLSLLLILLVFIQSYIMKGQNSVMGWGLWIIIVIILFVVTGVI